jgi:hypothetical protein
MQTQEVVKHLHGRQPLLGQGFVFEGAEHSSYKVSYPIDPECPWHEAPAPVESMPQFNSDTPLEIIWQEAARRLGGIEALDLARELVERLECPSCGTREPILQPAEKVRDDQLQCPRCGNECAPTFVHSISEASALLKKTVREIGLPAWDIIWARRGTESLGFEISGDNPFGGVARERSGAER